MTITELIKKLEDIRDVHGDIRVLVDGYEMYYDDPKKLKVEEYHYIGYDPDYYGKYQEYNGLDPFEDEGEPFMAVVIPR